MLTINYLETELITLKRSLLKPAAVMPCRPENLLWEKVGQVRKNPVERWAKVGTRSATEVKTGAAPFIPETTRGDFAPFRAIWGHFAPNGAAAHVFWEGVH